MKIVFFFLFSFFFFSFYLLFLLKPSPIFFISSFLSPTGFSVPHKHLTATPSGPPTPPPVTAAKWIYVVVYFLSQLIFIFPLFWGMVMYANDFETKEKQKLPEIKKLTAT